MNAILLRNQVGTNLTPAQYAQIIGIPSTQALPNIQMWFAGHSSRYALQTMSNVNKQLLAVQAIQFVVTTTGDMTNSTALVSDVMLPQAEDLETDLGFRSIEGGFIYCPKSVQPQGESHQMEWMWTQPRRKIRHTELVHAKIYNRRAMGLNVHGVRSGSIQ